MGERAIKIKEGVKLHIINTNKYKTNIISVFLSKKLEKEKITKEALIPAVLRLGTASITTQKELNKALEEMYGANFNCGIEKIGDNHVLKFYIETINDEYALNKEPVLNNAIQFIMEVIFNPLIENGCFKKSYVDGEKENLRKIIESRIDNKRKYSYIRCVEEMYKDKPYGLYEYGYIEDLERINENNLYESYREFINNCKIDIFVSVNMQDETIVENTIKSNEKLKELNERQADIINDSINIVDEKPLKEVEEKLNVAQGNIVIGLDLLENNRAAANVYNAILGGGANSKLFQNVREKASLAYTAGSRFLKTKNNIFILCGIEIANYNKTIEIIKKQLDDMKNGNFTDEDIKNAKELLSASINSIKDEQTSEISYYMSGEILQDSTSLEETANQINKVYKEDIINIANSIKINTIYFLRN